MVFQEPSNVKKSYYVYLYIALKNLNGSLLVWLETKPRTRGMLLLSRRIVTY